MDFKPDINKVIVDLCDRALVAREVRNHMADIEDVPGYSKWSTKVYTLADVLGMLTGRNPEDCLTESDLLSIRKEYDK